MLWLLLLSGVLWDASKMKGFEPIYLVVINLSGVHGPVRCYRLSESWNGTKRLYDKSGNWDAVLSGKIRNEFGYYQFQSGNLNEAKLFAEGARAVCEHLRNWAK